MTHFAATHESYKPNGMLTTSTRTYSFSAPKKKTKTVMRTEPWIKKGKKLATSNPWCTHKYFLWSRKLFIRCKQITVKWFLFKWKPKDVPFVHSMYVKATSGLLPHKTCMHTEICKIHMRINSPAHMHFQSRDWGEHFFRLSFYSFAFSFRTAPPSGLLSPCPWSGPAVWLVSLWTKTCLSLTFLCESNSWSN